MAAELVWLEEAEADLDAVGDHISTDSPQAAQAYVNSILAACEKLSDFPLSGRQYNTRYRVLVVRNHLVFYRHDKGSNQVIIAAVVDGRRDVAQLVKYLPARDNKRDPH